MSGAAARLQADYLTCTLCSQPFCQPKTLPCLHNFCKACLSQYLEEEMKGGRSSTFNCPECREKIYVPDPSKPANRWAAQFPTNFTLSGMLEAIAQEAEAKGRGVAMVKEARERRGMYPDTTDRHGENPSEPKKGSKEKQLSKHDSQDSNFSPDIQSTQARLSNVQSEIQRDCDCLQQDITATKERRAEEQRRLDQSFTKIFTLLEARKAQLEEELEESLSQERARLQQKRQGCLNDLESLASCEELLSGLAEKPVGDDVVYDMLLSIDDQVKEIKSRRLSQILSRSIRFEQTLEAARSVLNLVNNLGQISISTSGHTREGSPDSSGSGSDEGNGRQTQQGDSEERAATKIRSRPKFLTSISTRQADGKYQQVYDLAVTANGVVVMTAHGSNVVQAARKVASPGDEDDGSRGYSVYAKLDVDTPPKCVAAIAPFYVAVTGTSCIYLVCVDEKLTLQRKIETGKDYQGIATYSEASLIASSMRPACVDFVGINGFISETVDRDHTTGNILLRQPQFITASKEGVIYVTDLGKNPKLLSINNAGKVRFQVPPEAGNSPDDADQDSSLLVPQGVCVDSQGNVYVVDRTSLKVMLFTSEGVKVKDVLTSEDGLTDPCAIAVDADDRIYVTNDFNEVLVFQVR